MEFLKSLFEAGALTWEQFSEAVTSKGYKLADLSTGNYVSKGKYDDDIHTRDTTITELTTQISTRDTDITNLKTQLSDGSKDSDTKIAELTQRVTTLQDSYDTQKSDYEKKIASLNYEYAVRDFANTKNFSSNAAKRDFINELMSANLSMKDKTILGAEDFAKAYQDTDPNAFVVETAPTPNEDIKKPVFVQPTAPTPNLEDNPFNFNFAGVR